MKKLIMAVAISAIAVGVNAAQYAWNCSDIASGYQEGHAEDNAIGTAYLFLITDDITLAGAQAAVAGGNFIKDGWDSKAIASTSYEATFAASSSEGLSGVTGDSFFAVIVADKYSVYGGDGTVFNADGTYAYVTDAVTPSEVKTLGKTTLNFGNAYSTSKEASAWTAQAVPEPTSGLLLLLGMAGLALRRKQA